jgi:hypothetical protein
MNSWLFIIHLTQEHRIHDKKSKGTPSLTGVKVPFPDFIAFP